MNIDRRNVLIGAGLVGISGCNLIKGVKKNQESFPDPNSQVRNFNTGNRRLNYGDDPWRSFLQETDDETPLPAAEFNPNYIAVLHLEVTADPFRLVAKRAHFPIDTTQNNDLAGISPRVIEVIEYLNGIGARPSFLDPAMLVNGLRGLGFTRQHHFIIYIKNRGVIYGRYPIWFADTLVEPRPNGSYNANPNRSFFEARVSLNHPITSNSDKFIYVKNYFYTATETGDILVPISRRLIGPTENMIYALKINALIESSDTPVIQIPLVIDPDTGNMGGGGGGALP